MVALPDAASIVRVALRGQYSGHTWNNGFYLQYSGTAPSVANLNAVLTAMQNAWTTNIAPLCPSAVTLTDGVATDLTNRGAAQTEEALTGVGTRVGTVLPSSVACVVSWKVNFRYRGGHPRSYLPAGVAADFTNGSAWTNAFVSATQTAANAFLTAVNAISVGGATYKMVALKYKENKVLLGVPVPLTIQTAVVHGRVDEQRRRLGKETA